MTEITIEQRIRATPSVVYQYLTDAEKWKLWQGVDARLDARVGGIFAMFMGNGMTARGQYLELVHDRKVVFTWGWVDRPGIPPGSTVVEIELEPDGEETVLILTHRAIPDDEAPLQQMGWDHYLPRLASVAAGVPTPPDPGPGG